MELIDKHPTGIIVTTALTLTIAAIATTVMVVSLLSLEINRVANFLRCSLSTPPLSP